MALTILAHLPMTIIQTIALREFPIMVHDSVEKLELWGGSQRAGNE